ncbi:hypothetical protein ACXX82_18060 [Glaciimonas sp. GNP009]
MVESKSLRVDAVRLVFERRRKKAAALTTLNWRPEDYALAEAYFAQNPPHGNNAKPSPIKP